MKRAIVLLLIFMVLPVSCRLTDPVAPSIIEPGKDRPADSVRVDIDLDTIPDVGPK